MIVITVGTQLPFDRLIRDMDAIAPLFPEQEFFAQIGFGEYEPRNFEFARKLSPQQMDRFNREARLFVSHAGIGTILTAQKLSRPIIIYPRQARYGEHRNDHQLATCKNLEAYSGIYIATDHDSLLAQLRRPDLALPRTDDIQRRRETFVQNLKNELFTRL